MVCILRRATRRYYELVNISSGISSNSEALGNTRKNIEYIFSLLLIIGNELQTNDGVYE